MSATKKTLLDSPSLYKTPSGQLHRTDGPAIEYSNGDKSWWINDQLHRTDGPAIERADGYKSWYINGQLHRTVGPAVERSNGAKFWYINGKELTEEQFNDKLYRALYT